MLKIYSKFHNSMFKAHIPPETGFAQRHLYSTGNWVCVCYPMRRNLHKKKEMYMADARNWRQLTQNIPTCWYILRWVTQNTGVGCTAQRQPPTPGILRSGGI